MKKNLTRIGFVVLLLGTLFLITSVLRVKSEHGVNQKAGLYLQPRDSIDVAMMGTSHIHCGVNTGLLWENYGIAAYDYSGAEQPLWMTYYYLKELYKYQNPQVIVLDMYAPAAFKEDYQYDFIAENIYGMRFSLNKMQMLAVSVEPAKLHQYFPSFAVYHSRYDDLEKEDFETFPWDYEDMEAFKGYTPYWKREPQQRTEISEDGNDGLTPKSEKYLKKIIDLTKKKGSDLVLIVAPYMITPEEQRTYNRITEIAAENGLIFINYNEYFGEIGLDAETDFNDGSHLNYWGSCKFTEYLGAFLDSYDTVPDRRGQEGYESWDKNVEIIKQELQTHEDATSEK